jgi:methyl-accepting chemotaxis protein
MLKITMPPYALLKQLKGHQNSFAGNTMQMLSELGASSPDTKQIAEELSKAAKEQAEKAEEERKNRAKSVKDAIKKLTDASAELAKSIE